MRRLLRGLLGSGKTPKSKPKPKPKPEPEHINIPEHYDIGTYPYVDKHSRKHPHKYKFTFELRETTSTPGTFDAKGFQIEQITAIHNMFHHYLGKHVEGVHLTDELYDVSHTEIHGSKMAVYTFHVRSSVSLDGLKESTEKYIEDHMYKYMKPQERRDFWYKVKISDS